MGCLEPARSLAMSKAWCPAAGGVSSALAHFLWGSWCSPRAPFTGGLVPGPHAQPYLLGMGLRTVQ